MGNGNRDRFSVREASSRIHCDDCGSRLHVMRVEVLDGWHRFVCASHPLPAALVGREVGA
jgi:hypothetical protein